MQKFTLFSILASILVLITVLDLVVHGYLQVDAFQRTSPPVHSENPIVSTPTPEVPTNEIKPPVEGNSDPENPVILISVEAFEAADFEKPYLEENTEYSGQIFEFIPFETPENVKLRMWKFFSGLEYIGMVYEWDFSSDPEALEAYLELKDRANTLNEIGNLNETNGYGEAFFYFNHFEKEKTVFAVLKIGSRIIAFSYQYDVHESMKKVLEYLE